MTAWYKHLKPHADVQVGKLDESVFAANLMEVADGKGRPVYTDANAFFEKTYLTEGLKSIGKRVVQALNGGADIENRVISLQTGFGGGKTHTLIALYHLAKLGKNVGDISSLQALVADTGIPNFEKANVAVFTNTTSNPTSGRVIGEQRVQTMWGELAYQLGGAAAYAIIAENDQQRVAPKGLFKQVLQQCSPALILVDELADYCLGASGIMVGASNLSEQTVSFLQELTEAIAGTDRCVLLATLPVSAKELSGREESIRILEALENRIARIGTRIKPVEDDEIFEVVRRRLFEGKPDATLIAQEIEHYRAYYAAHKTELPDYVQQNEYRSLLAKSYPFHPELINMFRLRWASNSSFQRTRGVLRLLASIVADLWQRQNSLPQNAFIHTSDIDFQKVDALMGEIIRLNGQGWDAVLPADVAGTSSNAYHIDQRNTPISSTAQGIAATLFLASFGSDGQNKGLSLPELKLCMMRPDGINHNEINTFLDKLQDNAHYLHYSTGTGTRYWFHTKPNVNILINQAKSDIKNEVVEMYLTNLLKEQTKNSVNVFGSVLVNPSIDIPEQKRLTLILLSPKHTINGKVVSDSATDFIKKTATKRGNSERLYTNTMLFLTCSETSYAILQRTTRTFLATQKTRDDYETRLERDQLYDLEKKQKEAAATVEKALIEAYTVVLKYNAKTTAIEILNVPPANKASLAAQINDTILPSLKENEWLLASVGQGLLREHNLFPAPQQPIAVKEAYESFLRFSNFPMITNSEALQQSLLGFCNNGSLCIAVGSNGAYSKHYLSETVPLFSVESEEFFLLDKSEYPAPEPPAPTEPTTPYPSATPSSGNANDSASPQPATSGSSTPPIPAATPLQSLTISGKVVLSNYSQIFISFISFLVNNDVSINISIKAKSTTQKPMFRNSPEMKSMEESARQLGLDFEVEE
jgi:hypothetical protein